MLIENDEFDWLGDVKPVGQQLQQKETLEPDEFDWLDNLLPISEMKEPEPKPSLIDQIKAFGKKAFPAVKKAIPAILSSAPGIKEPLILGMAGAPEPVDRISPPPRPEVPEIRAMTPKEELVSQNIQSLYTPKREYPKTEDLGYGFIEKLLDIPGQFLTEYVSAFSWGLPELLPGEKPEAKSELAGMTGGLGRLFGLMGAGAGGIAKLAPFKVTGKVATRLWKKPAKTMAGKLVQNVTKTANTLGLALGATEWEGRDALEILRNKKDAFLSGEALGAFFGTMQFVNFQKAAPILSKVLRVGLGTALLDMAESKSPLDERSLFQKAYDYGLNYYFLKEGVSPKEYQKSFEGISREARRFNREAAKDGMKINLPETPEAVRALLAKVSVAPEPGFIATEKTVMPVTTPEKEIILKRFRDAEIVEAPVPVSPKEQTINIKPLEDGSIDVKIKTPGVVKPTEAEPSPKPDKSLLEQAKELHEKGVPRKDIPEEILKAVEREADKASLKRLTKAFEAEEKGEVLVSPAEEAAKKVERERPVTPRVGEEEKAPELPFETPKAEPEPTPIIETKVIKGKTPPAEEKPVKKAYVDFKQKSNEELESMVKYGAQKEKAQSELDRRYLEEEGMEAPEKEPKPEKLEVKEKKGPLFEQIKTPEIETIIRKLEKGTAKELTAKEKVILEDAGLYKGPEKELEAYPKPLPEPEMEKTAKKIKLVRLSIKTPTGKMEDLGEIPVEKLESIKKYAKSKGVEDKLKIGKEFDGKWGDYLPPAEIVEYTKGIINDVKEQPAKVWKEWQKEDSSGEHAVKDLYAGLSPPEFVKNYAKRALNALQIEPQFKKIGAPDTGLALKRFHSIRNMVGGKALREIGRITKSYDLSEKEWQDMTFIAAKPGKFKPMTPEQRTKISPIYRDVRAFYKAHRELLEEKNIPADWPYSHVRRLKEERNHLEIALKKPGSADRAVKIKKQLGEINDTLDFISRSKLQYVNIPTEWISSLFEKDPKQAPRIISQFFRERKTVDMEQLARWLIEKGHIKPEDTDIRRVMASYANTVGKKVALAEIFNTAEGEGLIKDAGSAPDTWQFLPSSLFPTLKGKKVHPALKSFMEKNFIRQGWQPTTLRGALGIVKMLQFYNPIFLPTYDVIQGFWTGSVRSVRTPTSIMRAARSMKNADKHYWDAMYWGAFSTPFTPSHRLFVKQADKIINGSPFLKKALRVASIYPWAWDLAWKGDNFIRMITYHHYRAKDFTAREAAQATARPHGDYASIPPATRKWINKIFFTPSFKIAMMSAQSGMVKNFAKIMTGQRKTMSKEEIASGKQAVGLAAGIVLRNLVMNALGFETDEYGLRYVKTVKTDEGKKKELVLYAASPDNVFARIYNRIKPLMPWEKEEKKLGAFINRAKWELHPLWQLSMEVLSNKGISFEPIYNPYDSAEKIAVDNVIYSANRIIRVSELLPMSRSEKRFDALKALNKDLGTFGTLFGFFVLPYVRATKDKRLISKINRLKRNFNYIKKQDPPKSLASAESRYKNFMDELKKLREELIEWRSAHE